MPAGASAIVGILASVTFVAIGAACAKGLVGSLAPAQVLWLRFAGFLAIMLVPTLLIDGRAALRPYRIDHQILRGILAAGAAWLIIASLQTISLAETMSIFYIYPVLTYALSVWLLGEESSALRWLSAGVGLLGVLVLVNLDGVRLGGGATLALPAALCTSARLVLHRHHVGRSGALTASLWERGIGFVIASLALPFVWQVPTAAAAGPIAGLILASVVAQLTLVFAIHAAPLGRLAPFLYFEILVALALDVALFGKTLDARLVVGIALIVSGGLIVSTGGRWPGRRSP